MTLADDILAALPYLREEAKSMMLSTCRVGVLEESVDPVTLQTTVAVTEVHYEGPCKVRFPGNTVSESDLASQLVAQQLAVVSIPVGTEDIRTGDGGVILENPLDPSLVGMKFRISGDHTQTFATARRFPVEVIS